MSELRRVLYNPEALVVLTRSEVDLIVSSACAHYDVHVQAARQPGGLIYGISQRLDAMNEAVVQLQMRELDLLMKTVENTGLHAQLRRHYKILADEYQRLNKTR